MNLLGHRVQDRISGLEGITTSRTEYLNRCIRYAIQPPVDKDGKVVEAQWADEEDLIDLGPAFAEEKKPSLLRRLAQSGGDRPSVVPPR